MALRKINFLSCSKLIFVPDLFFVPPAIVFKFPLYFSHEWNKFLHVRTVLSIPPINSRNNCQFGWQKSARTRIYLNLKARLEPHRTERQYDPERLGYLFVKRLFDLCHDALRIKLFGTRIKHNCFLFSFGAADRSIFQHESQIGEERMRSAQRRTFSQLNIKLLCAHGRAEISARHRPKQNIKVRTAGRNFYHESANLLRAWWAESMVEILAGAAGFSIIERRLIVGNRNIHSLALWRTVKSPSRGNYKLFICQPFVFDFLAKTSPATR